ncbi:hypothetical protein BDV93DRAFT_562519 [Ceratobasidium sp. AG-I]|nr:hypothetical protein BDV93DRAFT_562519 [Ceratobasidium sp. AG-I]
MVSTLPYYLEHRAVSLTAMVCDLIDRPVVLVTFQADYLLIVPSRKSAILAGDMGFQERGVECRANTSLSHLMRNHTRVGVALLLHSLRPPSDLNVATMVLVKPRKTPPKTTTRSHPLLVARGFFTVEEDKWIWEHMEEFSHVQGRGRVDSPNGQHRVTVAAAHHARLKAAFESVFPYRNPHPEHGTMVEKDKAGLMCSVWDWENIGGRIYNFLRRRLNSMERRKRSEALWGSEYPPYLDEARDLGSDYQMDGESAEEVVRAMGEIGRESCYSWAEVNDSEITRCQTNLPIDMQTMANLLSRSTGAEIYTVAVWQRDGQVMCCEYVLRC